MDSLMMQCITLPAFINLLAPAPHTLSPGYKTLFPQTSCWSVFAALDADPSRHGHQAPLLPQRCPLLRWTPVLCKRHILGLWEYREGQGHREILLLTQRCREDWKIKIVPEGSCLLISLLKSLLYL